MRPAIADRFAAMVAAGKISRQRAYQLRHLESGKCVKCSQPRVTKTHCLQHAVYERERQRRKYNAQEEHRSKVRVLEEKFVPPPLEHLPAA